MQCHIGTTQPDHKSTVASAFVTGNGTDTGWVTGAPATGEALYEDVDEQIPDDATTYIASNGNPSTATFNVQDASAATPALGASDEILIVKSVVRVRRNSTNTSGHKIRLRSGATTQDTTATYSVVSAWNTKFTVNETDPDTAAAWTQSGFNGLQIGVQNNAANGHHCTHVRAMLLYTPAAATNIAPAAGTLTLTGATPTVSFKTNIAPAAGTLTLTGATPGVAAKTNIAPSAGSLTLTGESPTVNVAAGALNVGAGSLTLTGATPTVSFKTNIAPAAGSLILTGEAPAVARKTNIVPAQGSLTLAGETPTISVGKSLGVAAGSLTLTGATPTVSFKVNIAPAEGALTLTGEVPVTARKTNIAPAEGSLTLSGEAPSVEITSGLNVSAGALTLTGATPTVAFKVNISPAAGSLSLSGEVPTVLNTGDVAPAPAPSADGGAGGVVGEEYGRRRQRLKGRQESYRPVVRRDDDELEMVQAAIEGTDRQIEAIEADLQALRALPDLSDMEDQIEAIEAQVEALVSRRQTLLLLLIASEEF